MRSVSGGGVPLSVASSRTRLLVGARDPVVVVPDSLQEARSLFSKFPPPPPGRSIPYPIMAKKARQCHGCHGPSDESHISFPLGANKCTRDHDDDNCPGELLVVKTAKAVNGALVLSTTWVQM